MIKVDKIDKKLVSYGVVASSINYEYLELLFEFL